MIKIEIDDFRIVLWSTGKVELFEIKKVEGSIIKIPHATIVPELRKLFQLRW